MGDKRTTDEPDVLGVVIAALNKVDVDGRERILKYVSDFFGLDISNGSGSAPGRQGVILHASTGDREPTFGDRRTFSPKDFLHEKQPQTDIERVTCLAFYLAHYRDTPSFKTVDIGKLNTEAAQRKFANPCQAVKNAIASGFVVPAGKGARQMSAIGERFVDALPDREDAKAVLGRMRPRRGSNKSSKTKSAAKATE